MLNHKGHLTFVVNPRTDFRFLIVTRSQGGMGTTKQGALNTLRYLLLMIEMSDEIPLGNTYSTYTLL